MLHENLNNKLDFITKGTLVQVFNPPYITEYNAPNVLVFWAIVHFIFKSYHRNWMKQWKEMLFFFSFIRLPLDFLSKRIKEYVKTIFVFNKPNWHSTLSWIIKMWRKKKRKKKLYKQIQSIFYAWANIRKKTKKNTPPLFPFRFKWTLH